VAGGYSIRWLRTLYRNGAGDFYSQEGGWQASDARQNGGTPSQ